MNSFDNFKVLEGIMPSDDTIVIAKLGENQGNTRNGVMDRERLMYRTMPKNDFNSDNSTVETPQTGYRYF